MEDKTNAVCAADMETRSMRFFRRPQCAVAHSIITDVGAFGVGAAGTFAFLPPLYFVGTFNTCILFTFLTVVREYPFGTQLHRDKCMMHQMSKVVIEIVHFYFSFALTSALHFVLFFC